MQMRAPDSIGGPAGKHSLGFHAMAYKTNAAERMCVALGNGDAKLLQSLDSIWHQAFAAGLVDGRDGAIRNDHA